MFSKILMLSVICAVSFFSGCQYLKDLPHCIPHEPPVDEPEEHLVAHWDFNELQGNVAHDMSGNGHDGAVFGAQWVTEDDMSGIRFSEASQYVEVPDHPDFELNGDYTVKIRCKVEKKSQLFTQTFWSRTRGFSSGVVDNKFGFGERGIESYYENESDADEIFLTKPDCEMYNTWHTFIFMRKGQSQYHILDDKLINESIISITPDNIDNCSINIGAWFNGNDPQGQFFGVIDYVKIYDGVDLDSLIIQPGPEESQDCHISYSYQDLKGGAWDNYNMGRLDAWGVGVYDQRTVVRGLLKIGLPSLIQSNCIENVRLRLGVFNWTPKDANEGFPIDIHKMLRSWKEGKYYSSDYTDKGVNNSYIDGATGLDRFWGEQDGTEKWSVPHVGMDDIDASSKIYSSTVVPYGESETVEFNITELAKEWLLNPETNYGMLLRSPYDQGSHDHNLSYPNFWSGDNLSKPQYRPCVILYFN